MKRIARLLILVFLLSGCSPGAGEMNRCLALRKQVLGASAVCFTVHGAADYGSEVFEFSMDCEGKPDGSLDFVMTAPETISGISGSVTAQGGKLRFSETVVAFPNLAEDLPSPVSAPWALYETLRNGFFRSAGKEGEAIVLEADSGYREGDFSLEITLDDGEKVTGCDIFDGERRILTLSVENFRVED